MLVRPFRYSLRNPAMTAAPGGKAQFGGPALSARWKFGRWKHMAPHIPLGRRRSDIVSTSPDDIPITGRQDLPQAIVKGHNAAASGVPEPSRCSSNSPGAAGSVSGYSGLDENMEVIELSTTVRPRECQFRRPMERRCHSGVMTSSFSRPHHDAEEGDIHLLCSDKFRRGWRM